MKSVDNVSFGQVEQVLAQYAPPALAESYDNVGLLVGHPGQQVSGILTCLDVTEAVLEEAQTLGANLIVAHHPVIFKGLKRLNGHHYTERIVIKAIQQGIGILAAHTNLDAVNGGVSTGLAERLGLQNIRVLQPQSGKLGHLTTYVPQDRAEAVLDALFQAGGGRLGKYAECAFRVNGVGSFMPLDGANPFSGTIGVRAIEQEARVELVYPLHLESKLVSALNAVHPYEEVAYQAVTLNNIWPDVGLGAIGQLVNPMEEEAFLQYVKAKLGLPHLKATLCGQRLIRTVAVAGGTCSFLTGAAVRSGADAFITADLKYHEWFEADGKLTLVDIGHYESEQHTINLLNSIISQKFANIAVHFTAVNTNPVRTY